MKMQWTDKYSTITFETGIDKFLVDIVSHDGLFTAWLYHDDYGIKNMMFGNGKPETIQEFIETVEANLPEYIKGYMEDYMQE